MVNTKGASYLYTRLETQMKYWGKTSSILPLLTEHIPRSNEQGKRFSVFCCGFVVSDFIHILQVYFTDTGSNIWLSSVSEVTLEDMGKCTALFP